MTATGLLDDLAMMLLVVVCIPIVLLAVGTPVALLVRLVIEIAQRL